MNEVINIANDILVLKTPDLLGLLLHLVNVSDITHFQSFQDILLLSLDSCGWTFDFVYSAETATADKVAQDILAPT